MMHRIFEINTWMESVSQECDKRKWSWELIKLLPPVLLGGWNTLWCFSPFLKNSRRKKLTLKKNSSETQGVFAQKLKKPAILGQKLHIFAQNWLFWTNKNWKIPENSRNLLNLEKLKPKICQKLKKSANSQILSGQKNG